MIEVFYLLNFLRCKLCATFIRPFWPALYRTILFTILFCSVKFFTACPTVIYGLSPFGNRPSRHTQFIFTINRSRETGSCACPHVSLHLTQVPSYFWCKVTPFL